jgi:BASS family bile acid:Na+ symporter
MPNSGLAATPGRPYFSPMAALPGGISVWQNLSGSLLAGYWNGRQPGGELASGATTAQTLKLGT